jgi:hypothetical protein
VALPVARELVRNNEVFAVARWSNHAQRRLLDEVGARTVAFDMAEEDLSPLPKSVDAVINCGVLGPTDPNVYNVNALGEPAQACV